MKKVIKYDNRIISKVAKTTLSAIPGATTEKEKMAIVNIFIQPIVLFGM